MGKRLNFWLSSSGVCLVLLLTAALLVGGCAEEAEEVADVVRPVKLMTIGGDNAGGQREYPGRVVAAEEVLLGFEVPGRIIELPVLEGQEVTAGKLIAKLDDRDYRAQFERDRARRNEARADYERNQTLYERDAISLRDLEVVRRKFEVTEANLRQTEKALNDTRLEAPFDGRVGRRQVENFENVRAKQPVVVFLDDSSLEIKAAFPETDFLRMNKAGSLAAMTALLKPEVEISAAPGVMIPAHIKEMRNVADEVTRTFEVTLGFTSPADLSIASGMTAKVLVKVPTGTGGVILVPTGAVSGNKEGESFVWIFDEASGSVKMNKVEVAQMTGESIEIVSGLVAGDRIAILGAKNLREGMRVRPYDQ